MSTVSSKLAFRFSAVTWPRNNPEKYLIEAWSDLTSLKRTQTSIWLWYITATVIKLPSFVCSYKLLEIWVIILYFSFTKSELFCYITIWKQFQMVYFKSTHDRVVVMTNSHDPNYLSFCSFILGSQICNTCLLLDRFTRLSWFWKYVYAILSTLVKKRNKLVAVSQHS